MKLRPCIDIHNGRVKQIVGSSLNDKDGTAEENFVSEHDAAYFAKIYREKALSGGHVIVLNSRNSGYHEASEKAAFSALSAYRNGMQYGGGINNENAAQYLDAGASHVIVTSFVFKDGIFDHGNLEKLQKAVGKDKIVLDLSCRKKEDGRYYVTTDRWQKYTDFVLTEENLLSLSSECAEFLIHAVDMEGKNRGVDSALIELLSRVESIPVTYAGGVRNREDIGIIKKAGRGLVDFTVGSALDLFGGKIKLDELIKEVKGI